MNTLRSSKRIVVSGIVTALLASTALAIPSDKLAELQAKAEAGNGISQYNLGLVYATPDEPIANIIEAYVWFSLAADNGAPGKALMIVTSQMTPEQISEGKKLLEQRRAALATNRSLVTAATTKTAEPVKPTPVVSPVVAAAESETAAAKVELAKANEQLAAANKESLQIKADLEKTHQAAIDKLKVERDQLAATVATYTNEISTMRAAAANFEGERNALQQKAAEATKGTNSIVAAELAATTAKLKTAEGELAKADATLNELNQTKQTLAGLNDQLQKLTADNQRLTELAKQTEAGSAEKLAASEKALNETNAELLQTQAKLAEATTKAAAVAIISTELATHRQISSDLSAQLQKLTAEKDEAIAQSAKATAEAKQQIDDLSSRLKASEEAVTKTLAENNELAQQVAAHKAAPPKQDTESLNQLAKLSAELQTYQRAAAAEKESLALQLKSTEEASARAQAESAALTQQIAALKAAPVEDPVAKAKIEKFAADLEAAQLASQEERKNLTAKLVLAETALAAAAVERSELEQKLATTAKSSDAEAAAQAKVDQLKAELTAAQAETAKAQASVAELENSRKEIADLQAKLKDSEQALAAAKTASVAAVAVAAAPEPVSPEMEKELNETKIKLDASLRSYQLQQAEVDRLQNALANIDNERAKLAERLQLATNEAASVASRATANNDAAAQLAGVREQLRQTQNQLASIAYENTELKHRLSFMGASQGTITPLPAANLSTAPSRPGSTKPAPAPVAEKPAARTHTVVSGDTLSTIAKRYYGSASRWTEIMEANKGTLRDPAALKVGMKLRIP